MGNQPLVVAAIAGALLVGVLGVDTAMNRTYYVEVLNGTLWTTLAQSPYSYETASRPYPGGATLSANASDDVSFRIRVDNTHWWSASKEYDVYVGATEVAKGILDIPARAQSIEEFTVKAETLINNGVAGAPAPFKDPSGFASASIEVHIGKETPLYAAVTVKEVAR